MTNNENEYRICMHLSGVWIRLLMFLCVSKTKQTKKSTNIIIIIIWKLLARVHFVIVVVIDLNYHFFQFDFEMKKNLNIPYPNRMYWSKRKCRINQIKQYTSESTWDWILSFEKNFIHSINQSIINKSLTIGHRPFFEKNSLIKHYHNHHHHHHHSIWFAIFIER